MSEQPSPSANADRWSGGWKAAVAYFQVDAEAFHTRNAATPSSITDMAPGTTFRVESPLISPAALWTVRLNEVDREKHALSTTGYDWMLEDIDPSTIRDVTPPESTNAH